MDRDALTVIRQLSLLCGPEEKERKKRMKEKKRGKILRGETCRAVWRERRVVVVVVGWERKGSQFPVYCSQYDPTGNPSHH